MGNFFPTVFCRVPNIFLRMFYKDGILIKSTLLDEIPGIFHGFSTRAGGASVQAHTATLNLSFGLGDTDEIVRENLEIFARAMSDGMYGASSVVMMPQIHSAVVRTVTSNDGGDGATRPSSESGDGFTSCSAGVIPVVRAADCVPILLAGTREDNTPVISAIHAGWRGTTLGISANAVSAMVSLGCVGSSIRVAIGAHIGFCCYEVGSDFYDSVRTLRGADFADRHIRQFTDKSGKIALHADLTSMNVEILSEVGVSPDMIDISPDCTMCMPDVYYSHRATHGKRGVHGAGIGIF